MPKRLNESTSQVRQEPLEYRASYNSDDQVEYEAWAEPDTTDSDLKWIICKHTYSATGRVIQTSWANSARFISSWDLKSTYF